MRQLEAEWNFPRIPRLFTFTQNYITLNFKHKFLECFVWLKSGDLIELRILIFSLFPTARYLEKKK